MAKKLIADKANCTFWWRIHLNPNHPDNKPTVTIIDGYSKFVCHNEAKNKEDVLMAKIEMFFKNGYLLRSKSIDIYTKTGPLPSITQDKHILTLFPKDYIIHEQYVSKMPWRIKEFLKNFYNAIQNGREVKFLRPLPNKIVIPENKDDIYKISKHNFKTHAELYAWSYKQKSLGEPAGLVNAFVKKYIEEVFNKTQPSFISEIAKNIIKKQ